MHGRTVAVAHPRRTSFIDERSSDQMHNAYALLPSVQLLSVLLATHLLPAPDQHWQRLVHARARGARCAAPNSHCCLCQQQRCRVTWDTSTSARQSGGVTTFWRHCVWMQTKWCTAMTRVCGRLVVHKTCITRACSLKLNQTTTNTDSIVSMLQHCEPALRLACVVTPSAALFSLRDVSDLDACLRHRLQDEHHRLRLCLGFTPVC